MVYRVYCNGTEMGVDYQSLESARKMKSAYAKHFPERKYYIRKAQQEMEIRVNLKLRKLAAELNKLIR